MIGTPSLKDRQGAFAAALLDPECPVPTGLVGPDGKPSLRRFNVYRNNVVAGLTATLKDAFPAVARIVGDEFFLAMARIYVAGNPPRSPIMLDYGLGFPDFLGGFQPVEGLPYLRDVARIERAWVEAYHSAEMQSLDPAIFAGIGAGDLPNVILRLHPSLRLVRSQFPSLTIWQMNVEGGVPVTVDLEAGGEDVFIIRPGAQVNVRSLPPGGLEFIQALGEGYPIIEAMKAAMAADYRFDLSANLAGLMETEAFIGCEIVTFPLPIETSRHA